MLSQTLVPNTGLLSKISGSGIGIPWGGNLQNAPTTGTNSPAHFVNNGTVAHSFLDFWTNRPDALGITTHNFCFDIGLDTISIASISGFSGRLAYSTNGTSAILSGVSLNFKKSNNSTLSNDLVCATGVLRTFQMGSSGILSFAFNIVEANRSLFPTNPKASLSGTLMFEGFAAVNSGFFRFADFDVLVSGDSISTNNINLYMSGGVYSNINLYEQGYAFASGNPNLYIPGPVLSSGIRTLYISGPTPSSGLMNLFLKGRTASSGNNTIALNLFSTTNSGLFKTLNLLTGYVAGELDRRFSLPLHMSGPDAYNSGDGMNLFLCNDTTSTENLDLYLANNFQAANSGINLLIVTPSGTEGSVPYSGNMSLYIARSANSIDNGMPLFVKTSGVGTSSANLYISGVAANTSGINLYTKGIGSANHEEFNLFSTGF